MAGSVNKVIIVGNLGREPEVRYAQDGSKIVNFSVATSEIWKDKGSGERKERTEWHRIVIFNDHLADVAERFLHKGSKVYLEGQLQTRKWTDNTGAEKYTTEVVLSKFRGELALLDARGSGGGSQEFSSEPAMVGNSAPAAMASAGGSAPAAAKAADHSFDDLEDDIPF
jgi:single-strand DNA-binding protein